MKKIFALTLLSCSFLLVGLYAKAAVYTQCQVVGNRGVGNVIQVGRGTFKYHGNVTYTFLNSRGEFLGNVTDQISIHLIDDASESIGSVRAVNNSTSCFLEIGSNSSSTPLPPEIIIASEKAECKLENGKAYAWFFQDVSSFGINVTLQPNLSFFYYDENDLQIGSQTIPTTQQMLPLGWSLITKDDAPPLQAKSCFLGFHWEFSRPR